MTPTVNRFARRLLASADRRHRRGTAVPAGVSSRLGQLGLWTAQKQPEKASSAA